MARYWRTRVSRRHADGLWLVDADGTNERLLVADLGRVMHGIGPVWSPTGDRIAYQRVIGCCENHEVVLVNVADGTETVIEPPQTDGPNGPVPWYPFASRGRRTARRCCTRRGAKLGTGLPGGVIAVPADTPSDVTVLTDAIDPVPGYDHRWALIQMWGRQPG